MPHSINWFIHVGVVNEAIRNHDGLGRVAELRFLLVGTGAARSAKVPVNETPTIDTREVRTLDGGSNLADEVVVQPWLF